MPRVRKAKVLEFNWSGPHSWPKFESESELPPIPKSPGVYLWTAEYKTGYIIYAAGITRRTIPTRFREHSAKYLSGEYTILDVKAMNQGIRKEIWHGWEWTPEKRSEYQHRENELVAAARRQLEAFKVFVTDVGTAPRLLERIEAAIMLNLYEESSPYCDLPDQGMMLAPRGEGEEPITIRFTSKVKLFGLPVMLEV
jgi:hypothetical protein